MHPALVILSVVLFVQSIAVLGKDRLQELLYAVYIRIVQRGTIAQQRKLRSEVFANKQQLAQTSSQDEFAKWAKLRRKVDKGLADLEKTNGRLATSRTTFTMLFKAAMFGLTTILPFIVTSYYGKTPIFWIPPAGQWFGPLGWFLSLPRAPTGSISSTMWQMVCTRALLTILSSLKSLLPVPQAEEVLLDHSSSSSSSSSKSRNAAGGASVDSSSEKMSTKAAGTARGTTTMGDDGSAARRRTTTNKASRVEEEE